MSLRMMPFSQFRSLALQSHNPQPSVLAQSLARPDQRRSGRALTAGLYAACQSFGPDGIAERAGTVVDLSAEGVGVALTEPYPAGTLVGIELLDAFGDAGCRVQARVRRTSQETSGRWHHGFELLPEGSDSAN
jgi:hypothetical protein